MKKLFLLIPLVLVGCRSLDYVSPEGRHIHLISAGFDTKIGRLEAETSSGHITISDFDSSTQAWTTFNKALDKIPNLGGIPSVPEIPTNVFVPTPPPKVQVPTLPVTPTPRPTTEPVNPAVFTPPSPPTTQVGPSMPTPLIHQ